MKPLVTIVEKPKYGTKQYYAWYRDNNKEKLLEYKRLWRKKNQEQQNDYEKQRYWSNPDEAREKRKAWHQKVRLEIIELMGGECIACGFRDWRALQVDHINGGGGKDRKSIAHSPSALLMKIMQSILKKEGKYQLLCANCNWIKRYERRELCKNLS